MKNQGICHKENQFGELIVVYVRVACCFASTAYCCTRPEKFNNENKLTNKNIGLQDYRL
jgi:hypothetical protein